ncbi:PilZ domain-containing protein [Desulfobacterales bacterium HSG17]|nr:PilZ domain-containing protein [Desulfobacterales bacterium HSG17]
MENNKRRFTRIPFKIGARIEVEDKSYTVNEIFNLSIGGCLLPLNNKLNTGIKCSVRITLSEINDNIGIWVEGEVVRSENNMTAVKFTKIDPDSLFHLQNILRYNAPDSIAIEEEIDSHPGII